MVKLWMLCVHTKAARQKKMIRTYTELMTRNTFEDRFNYLRLGGSVGSETFGFDRYINQRFYGSTQWKQARDYVIARDLGLDLAVEGHEIYSRILIHHMNPINAQDIRHADPDILDPEFLICTQHDTHNAIHYGDVSRLPKPFVERAAGDTKLW